MNEENTNFIDGVFDWLREVYSAYENNTLPTRGYTKSVYACKNCPVKKKCWKEMEDGELEVENLVVPK
jgi:hypothetical protein